MSWDVFVQDLPDGITDTSQIPDDFEPKPIGSREVILREIQATFPEGVWSDENHLSVDQQGCVLDLHIGNEDPCTGFGFAVYGGDSAPSRIASLLGRLKLRALDVGAKSGLFDLKTAKQSLRKHEAYRDQVNQKRFQ